MTIDRRTFAAVLATLAAILVAPSFAQDKWPSPYIGPSPPGHTTDTVARLADE